jgi:glycine dehydrogenase
MKLTQKFAYRHIGPAADERKDMLNRIGVSSLDDLIDQTIPKDIRLTEALNIAPQITEHQYLGHLRKLAAKNKLFQNYIGLGYYGSIMPAVIQRNVLENPGWYTAYTPYQPEISQGRLEALLNYQTMIAELTGLPIANASLLDEATAAAEAMLLFYHEMQKGNNTTNRNKFFVSGKCFPQTIGVLKSRSEPLGIELVVGDLDKAKLDSSYFGILLQYPDAWGEVNDYEKLVSKLSLLDIKVCVAADLMALVLLKSPGQWGADCVVGNTQRFGMPLGFGGPHAGFFACKDAYKRLAPGRIIGISKDSHGIPALRMALQTREQHIKREKATSNICTAQALPAIMASMYAVYHGAAGLTAIAERLHLLTLTLATGMERLGYVRRTKAFFDTLVYEGNTIAIRAHAEKNGINFRYISTSLFAISLDETTDINDIDTILNLLAYIIGQRHVPHKHVMTSPLTGSNLKRSGAFLQQEVFRLHRSETAMMRYIKQLENKDLSLVHSMIPLGSCTMKLNAAAELLPLTWPEFAAMHPFAPADQAGGYAEMIRELGEDLCEITGFAGISFQPNSGAQGEYAGLMVIRAYHRHRGEDHRNITLIPSSAHGTNPASAAMAGMEIDVVACDINGNIDLSDLKKKADQYRNNLACLMLTYPSTHGVYEESVKSIIKIIHGRGGQVYMDGANMNAQVGLTSPGFIGADVCHLNLHKTFAIPHGGGGPGMGPIAVAKHLVPFLPGHFCSANVPVGQSINPVSAAPYGSALILLISYGYIKMLGAKGLTEATKVAILNANYLKDRLKEGFKILYTGANGRCAHEFIIDCQEFKKLAGVEVGDIAKRLMDYGFHAPTVGFPVHDTLMIEPTESENKQELDRFCEAMLGIREELDEVLFYQYDQADNVFKNAPHTLNDIATDDWKRAYSRQKAVFPSAWVKNHKFWPAVNRIDNAAGDRNLICTCPATADYQLEAIES